VPWLVPIDWGLGKQLMNAQGISGFYLSELFKFEPEIMFLFNNSIELGRAFVCQKYQQRPMPLFLLWKGIIHATLRYPEYDYLMGSVSISNQFSKFTKSLMIEFMRSHYYDPYLAQYITPKKEFKVKLDDGDKEFVFDETLADLNKFDKLIDELEPGALRLPVLIKKYIKQNARVVSFNTDPLFNNAIDSLMYIKIKDIPSSTVKPVLEEFQASLEQIGLRKQMRVDEAFTKSFYFFSCLSKCCGNFILVFGNKLRRIHKITMPSLCFFTRDMWAVFLSMITNCYDMIKRYSRIFVYVVRSVLTYINSSILHNANRSGI
jgi:hypothetical protein